MQKSFPRKRLGFWRSLGWVHFLQVTAEALHDRWYVDLRVLEYSSLQRRVELGDHGADSDLNLRRADEAREIEHVVSGHELGELGCSRFALDVVLEDSLSEFGGNEHEDDGALDDLCLEVRILVQSAEDRDAMLIGLVVGHPDLDAVHSDRTAWASCFAFG